MWRAARSIGRGAEEYEHNCIKKFEQLPLKLGKINYTYYLMYCCSDKMGINQAEGSYPQDATKDPAARQRFVDEWISAPERFKQFYMEWEPRTNPTMEAAMHIADWNEIMHYMDDATGLCAFCSSFRGQFGGGTAYHIYNVPYFLKIANGMDIDADDLWRICRRNRNLVRAINVSRGLRRDDERPPQDHWAVREPENEEKLIHDYYEYKGWTSDGIPSKETLDGLGLDFVANELIRRGILTGNETEGKFVEYPLYTGSMTREATNMVRKVESYTLTDRLRTEKYEGKEFGEHQR
jgi:aldehyde:ferredoxin oxidoreductase